MRGITYLLGAVVALTVVVVYKAHPSGHSDGEAAPIFGVKIPPGYRDWRLISVAPGLHKIRLDGRLGVRPI
jgi:hypothetical protein